MENEASSLIEALGLDANRSPDRGRLRDLQRGEQLIRRGDHADSLFLVLRGRFDVRVAERTVAEIAEGQPVGEIAFFTGGERTADVIAGRDASVLELTRADFDALVAERPDVGVAVTRWLASRLAKVAARVPALERSVPRCTCVLPAATGGLPTALVDALRRAMPGIRFIGVADLPTHVDKNDEATIAAYLLDREGRDGRTIYLIEKDGAFARAAVRQSDAVALVAELGSGEREPSPLERYAAELHEAANASLVLWREQADMSISGTPEWLAPRAVNLHHHVALDRAADAERLARFITGRARGMVMGGGGALGCAHMGVARAILEAGMPIDMWGGTSFGGAIAIAFGMGLSPEEVMDRVETIFLHNAALGRLTVPLYGLMDPHHFERQMQEHYGQADITDLPFNAFAASTSLTTNDLYVHRSGPTWVAVRSTGSLPLVLPPFVMEDGEVLVDGGLIDNLPIGTMRGLKRGPNVMVNLAPDREYRLKTPYSELPMGRLRLLGDLVRRKRRGDLPKMGSVLSRTMVVSSRRLMAATEIGDDILVTPPSIRRMGLLDWKKARAQEQQAYEHTRTLIENGEMEALRQPT